jgi:hypothetical protein
MLSLIANMQEGLVDKGSLFIISFLIFIGLCIFFAFLIAKGIRGRNEELPPINVLFGKSSNGKSSNGHDQPQALPSESIQKDNPSKT